MGVIKGNISRGNSRYVYVLVVHNFTQLPSCSLLDSQQTELSTGVKRLFCVVYLKRGLPYTLKFFKDKIIYIV
jgi:hypothetical protein